MTNMTLKELIKYEKDLCNLQQEYEGKLSKIYGGLIPQMKRGD